MYQSFTSVGVRRDYSLVKTLTTCGGSLFSITRKSVGKSDCGAHDIIVVGIRTWLQVNSNVSDKVAVWLRRDDIVKTFPIC